jgi:3-oxoacyl-[acyl-carrier-protein] synthase-3
MTTQAPSRRGVKIIGTGSAVPPGKLTNADLEKVMDTTDEWIVQRTGIRERHVIASDGSESVSTLGAASLRLALEAAHLDAKDLDLVIMSTMTAEMSCPPSACLVAAAVKATRAGAFDLNGACCGFVFGLNVAHDLVRGGAYNTVALVGADTLTTFMSYNTAGRGTSIIFGDAAASVIIKATDDTSKGLIAQSMHADGQGWKEIYIPRHTRDLPPGVAPDPEKFNRVQMNGAGVFKFAVGTFPQLIQETLDKARLTANQVDMYVCHQSNARILAAAREKFGLPPEKLYVNIDRYGNTVAASVPLCLDELVRSGRVTPGMKVMFLGFGGGLTWGSSLWQL